MHFLRHRLRQLYLPLVALIFAVQALAVAHEVRHDIWGGGDNCAICSVASHSTAPAPVAPVIATLATVVAIIFDVVCVAPRLADIPASRQARAPPVALL